MERGRREYSSALAEEARRLCLTVAMVLGELMDEVVVVGGLVPSLIIEQRGDVEPHVGTRDLDLGFSLALLNEALYEDVAERLSGQGFGPMTNARGHLTRQTWGLSGQRVQLDFLIAPASPEAKPGRLQSFRSDFAAIIAPALPLAFIDQVGVELDDLTVFGTRAARVVQCCGPAAFVALKAHAIRHRRKAKDAYDLLYMLKNYGEGDLQDLVTRYGAFAGSVEAAEALRYLAAEFASAEHEGPARVEAFWGQRDPAHRVEAARYVQAFVRQAQRALGER